MSTKGVIGIQGLKTSGNELAFPPGSLTQADNTMVAVPGVIQPRRGQKYSSLLIDNDVGDGNANRATEMWQWLTHLFVQYTGDAGDFLTLFENLSTYHALGAFSAPEPTVMRMKFAALAQSAYFCTSLGLYGLDKPGNSPRAAGMQRPGEIVDRGSASSGGTRITGNPSAAGSWLASNNAVAYRAVIGRKDGNDEVKLSEPCGRFVVVNPADLVIAIGGVVLLGNVVTVALAAGQTHGFAPGDVLSASSTDASIGAGPYTVTAAVPGGFTYSKTAANHTSSAAVTYSSGFKEVQIRVLLSTEAVAGNFIQLYRTDESGGASIDPGDECFQCFEQRLLAADIITGAITITDTTPSSFLGAPLPTNANTGDGPDAGANDKPPMLRDICTWDSKLFGIQMYDRHRLVFRILGCGSPAGLQDGDKIAINTRVFESASTAPGGSGFVITTADLPSQNIVKTCQSILTTIVLQMPGCSARFEYDGTSPTGELLVDEVGLGGSGFADASSGAIDGIYAATSRQSAFADALALLKTVVNANTSRTSNVVTVRAVGHGFSQGDVVMVAYSPNVGADPNFHPGLKTVTQVVDADNFKYTETGSNATLGGGFFYYVYATTFKSDNGGEGVRFTKSGEPESWPLPLSLGGLPDGASPLRIKPTATGNALMVFLKNGDIYRVSGQYPYNVRRFDGTATLVAPDSLQEHNGQLYGLTTQGVVAVGEGGVGVVGRDVEDDMRTLIGQLENGGELPVNVWGLSYESDRQYQLWDMSTANAFVLNSLDGQWTKFGTFGWARSCGLVFRGLDYMILGDLERNQPRLERKNFGSLASQFADEEYILNANGNQTNVSTVLLTGGAANISVGDAVQIGFSIYLVTAVNAGLNTFTINGTVTVTNNQAFTFFKAFTTQLAFSMDAAGIPGVEKMFRELQLHFSHRLFSKLTVSFSNEKSGTAVTVTVTPDDFAIGSPAVTRLTIVRVDVPNDLRRSALLKVQLTLTEAFSYFRLLGYSATSEPTSERTGK